MKKQKSIKVNFFMNALLMMSSVVFPLITSSHVARVLGPNGTGIVDFVYPMVMYFSMIAQLGIPTYGIRICAKVRDDKVELSRVVQELLAINMITCVLAYICFFAAIALVPQMQEQKTLFYILGSLILLNTIGVEWLYKGLEEYSYITIRSLIFKVIVLICIVTMIQKESDYVLYGALFIMAQVGSNIVNFLHLHKIIIIKPVGGYHFKRHLKPIMSFFAMSIATTIYTSVDTTMIRFMKGYAENSFYSQSVKIKTALVNVVTALGAVLLPRASYYLEKGLKDEFLKISRKALHFIFVAAIPLSLYFMLAAKPSILFLFGDKYTRSITAMQLIMPTVFAIGLSNILGIQMLIPMGRENVVVVSEIVGAVVDVIINALLISKYGASGAAIGTVTAEFAVLAVQAIALKTTVLPLVRQIPVWKHVLAAAVSSIPCIAIVGIGWGNFVTLMVSAVLFFGIYLIVLILLKEPFIREYVPMVTKFLSRKK